MQRCSASDSTFSRGATILLLDGEHDYSLTIHCESLESTAAAAGRDQMATTAAAPASVGQWRSSWPLWRSCSSAQHLLGVRLLQQLQLELKHKGTWFSPLDSAFHFGPSMGETGRRHATLPSPFKERTDGARRKTRSSLSPHAEGGCIKLNTVYAVSCIAV